MPFKNAAPFLASTLKSLQQQSFTHWELLAVNDQSSDGSLKILLQAARQDERIQVFRNRGQGILPALQLALEKAQGIMVSRLDADDLLPPQRLEKMVSALQQSQANSVVTGLVQYYSESTLSPGYIKYQNWLNANLLSKNPWRQVYRECIVASPNWLMYRTTMQNIGGFHLLQYPEDYDLVLRWYAHGLSLICLPEVTLLWREHPKRTSRNSANYQQAAFFKLKLKRFCQMQNPLQNLVLLGQGQKAKLAAQNLEALGFSFTWLGLQYQSAVGRQQAIESYKKLKQIKSPLVLVAVYPPQPAKKKLEAYFNQLALAEGEHWWYL
jgi:glycosyltransferase involved in cell wall biosynthesis